VNNFDVMALGLLGIGLVGVLSLRILHDIIEMNPDLRFSQILSAFDFVNRIELDKHIEGWHGHVWADEFNTEPTVILERVQKAIKERTKS
jgi:hypothetical protein